jgi:small subunit ribosomal protein S20
MKKVNKAILEGDKDAAQVFYKAAAPMIDKMAGKGLIHAHKAARHKSRLNKSVRAM